MLAGLGLLAFAMLTLVDFSLGKTLASQGSMRKNDLYYLFRVWGSIWPWLLFSVALALSGEGNNQANHPKKSAFLLLSPILSGACAELLKLTLRRERPSQLETYVFRSFTKETLENPAILRENGIVSSGVDWLYGRKAVRFR